MKLKILYVNGTQEEIEIKRFSDLSTHKTKKYYFERPFDERGKGTCINRDEVDCVEVE